jgi:IS5 family transposase
MINLRDPLAVLATRLPWAQIEALLSPKFEHLDRAGDTLESRYLLGPVQVVIGAGRVLSDAPDYRYA